jgi:hypothetical protein
MSLRYPVQIQRRAPGAWVNGRWVVGALGPVETIQATIQPAQLSDYDRVEPLLEGQRIEALARVYTSEVLQVMSEDPTASGDLLIWPLGQLDRPYVFIARSAWQSRIIPHYRYLAARLVAPR